MGWLVMMASESVETVASYAARWLARSTSRYRAGTLRGYASVLRCHVLPALGTKALPTLTRRDVRDLLITKLADGLSAGAVRMIYATLCAVLTAAEDDELVTANVARGSARRLWRAPPDGERKAPSRADFQRLLTASRIRYPILVPLWIVLANTGLRPGEGLALRVDDVDLEARRLTVRRTYHGAGRFGPVKSGKARTVPLNDTACAVLGELVRAAVPPGCWLFDNGHGQPWSPCYPQRAFRRLRTELRFRGRLVPHSLRHATATWLIERGAREVHVQRLLGHHSIQLTIDLYARGADLPPIVDLLEERHGPRRSGRARQRSLLGGGGGR